MRQFKCAALVVVQILALTLSGCGQLLVDPDAGQGSSQPRWLTFQIRQMTVLADMSDGLDGYGDFQIYTIMTDGTTSAKLAYPAEGVIPVSAGQSVPLGKFALSVDENSIGDELLVYVVAVDIDEQSSEAQLATDVALELLTGAVLAAATQGASLAAQVSLGALSSQATGALADWIREADVIGEETFLLRRSSNWSIGPAITHQTADGGLEIVYQTYLGQELPAHLAWSPPTPTSEAASSEQEDPLRSTHVSVVGQWRPYDKCSSVAFAPNGDLVFTSCPERTIARTSISGDLLSTITSPYETYRATYDFAAVAVDARGYTLARTPKTILVYDQAGTLHREFDGEVIDGEQRYHSVSGIRDMAAGAHGQMYLVGDPMCTVDLYDWATSATDDAGNPILTRVASWSERSIDGDQDQSTGCLVDVSTSAAGAWALVRFPNMVCSLDPSRPLQCISLELPSIPFDPPLTDKIDPGCFTATPSGSFYVASDRGWLHHYRPDGTWVWSEDIGALVEDDLIIADMAIGPQGQLVVLPLFNYEVYVLDVSDSN